MEFRNIKMKTPNREVCRAVQQFLFENDCSWSDGEKQFQHLHSKFLYVDSNGQILWGSGQAFFDSESSSGEYKEVVFETELTTIVKPATFKLKNRPKITVLGTEYFVDELETHLTTLEAAQ